MRDPEQTKTIFLLLIGVLLFSGFLAVPSAAVADGGDPFLVHACVNPSGLTRIVGPDDACGTNQTPVHWPKPVGPASVEVDCALGQKIAEALESPGNPLTITIKGTCSENVTVARDTVTLQADPAGGTVSGPDPSLATITVAGQDVLVDGLRVTGGRNGIEAVGAVRLLIQNCLVEGTGRNGITFDRGANGVVDHCTVQNNLFRDGIAVVNGSTAVVTRNTITGNGRRGVHLFQNSNALIGITSTSQAAGNTISNNGGRGISIVVGSSASIGANTISGNGTAFNPEASQRGGVVVFQSTADVVGGNTITGNAGSGILVISGNALVGDPGFIPVVQGFPSSSANTITGNGAGVAPGFGDGGVFAFQAASINIRDATINGNTGNGVTGQLRSTVQLRGNSTVTSNMGHGIFMNLGSGLLFDTSIGPVTVAGNTVSAIVCNLPEASVSPFPVAASGLTIIGSVICSSF